MFQASRPRRKAAKLRAAPRAAITPNRELQAELSKGEQELSDYLREWRRNKARQQGIAAFVVMHDTTLEALSRARPRTPVELRGVPGFGERKLDLYGQEIFDALRQFDGGARATEILPKKSKPAEETLRLLAQGRTLEEIANARGRQLSTVVSMVAEMVERGELEFQPTWMEEDAATKIESLCAKLGTERLKPIKDQLPAEISFDHIRLVLAKLRRRQAQTASID
jgi:ATP-dependent DNA helicase RecQ